MSIVYAGLDLGSSYFHQVAISSDGTVTINRSFPSLRSRRKHKAWGVSPRM